jgi:hypothetical protein
MENIWERVREVRYNIPDISTRYDKLLYRIIFV